MRVKYTGAVGITDGFYWTMNPPSDNDIDADNDSVMNPAPNYLIDLSKVASNALGQQCPLMATYRLHSIKVGIRPVDDAVDNDEATHFAGRHYYRLMTDHMKTALQLARRTEKEWEGMAMGSEGLFLSDEKSYTGFRFNWYDGADHEVVEHTTLAGMAPFYGAPWSLNTICNVYDYMTAPDEENALFNGRAPGVASLLWNCGWTAAPFNHSTGSGGLTHVGDDIRECHLDIVPLIAGSINYSSGNEPGTVDDDYLFFIEVDFTVGGSF